MAEDTDCYVTFHVNQYTVASNYNIELMIESGETQTEYDAYSGGYASPSPNYSMPIHNVSGNININLTGRNLYNIPYEISFTRSKNVTVYIPRAGNYNFKLESWSSSSEEAHPTIRFGLGAIGGLQNKSVNLYEGDVPVTIYAKTDYAQSSGIPLTVKGAMLCYDDGEDYDEYKAQTITFPLSTGQKMYEGDYLADDGIHHMKKQIVLDGTEDWNIIAIDSAQTKWQHYLSVSDLRHDTEIPTVYSNDFKATIFANRGGNNDNSSYSYSSGIAIRCDEYTTNEAWKSFLSTQYQNSTPVIVEYALKEYEVEQYTETQQTAWNNIKKLQTYKNITNISVSSESLFPNVNIIYYKDLNVVLDNLNNAILSQGADV